MRPGRDAYDDERARARAPTPSKDAQAPSTVKDGTDLRKKEMPKERLDQLRVARERALEVRRERAGLRRTEKDIRALLLTKQRQEIEQMKQSLGRQSAPTADREDTDTEEEPAEVTVGLKPKSVGLKQKTVGLKRKASAPQSETVSDSQDSQPPSPTIPAPQSRSDCSDRSVTDSDCSDYEPRHKSKRHKYARRSSRSSRDRRSGRDHQWRSERPTEPSVRVSQPLGISAGDAMRVRQANGARDAMMQAIFG
jgi:hypothetical protein